MLRFYLYEISIETDSRLVGARAWGWGMTTNGYGAYWGGNKSVLELDSSDGCTAL